MNNDLNRFTFLEKNHVKFNSRSTKSMSERGELFFSIPSLTDWCYCLTRRPWNAVPFFAQLLLECICSATHTTHSHPHSSNSTVMFNVVHDYQLKLQDVWKFYFFASCEMNVIVCSCVYMCHVSRLQSPHISLLHTYTFVFVGSFFILMCSNINWFM